MKKTLKISFDDWLHVVLKNDMRAVKQVLCLVGLEVAVLILGIKYASWPGSLLAVRVFLLLTAVGIGLAFLWALVGAWKRDRVNPPQYLIEHCREVKRNGDKS